MKLLLDAFLTTWLDLGRLEMKLQKVHFAAKFSEAILSQSVENGQAIGDATRLRDNLTTKVGHEAAPGGQLTLKDDSDAKITKGPKMKEKKLKSDKPDPSEEAQDLNKTKIIFQP